MQILFLVHRLPFPPDKGERIRAFHELKYLAARHEVDLFCFADNPSDARYAKDLKQICRSVYAEVLPKPQRLFRTAWAALRGQSMSAGYFHSPTFAAKIQQALRLRHYDAIFVYCSSMGQYLPAALPSPLVVDFVDADSAKWRQYASSAKAPRSWLYAREAAAVADCENRLLKQAAVSLAVTRHDAQELGGGHNDQFAVEVMPNGVEVPPIENARKSDVGGLQPYAVFVGTMSYRPNADAAEHFARDIFPQIRQTHPELQFVIVGRDPDRKVRQLASLPGVTVTGAVPDVYQYFRNAAVSVAPFRISQGFHNKIAESLAVGTPVVTSSRAVAGIGLSEREGLFAADSAQQFVETVSFVLSNKQVRDKLREAAPAVRKLLSWQTQLHRLEELMLGVAGQPVKPSSEMFVSK